jgi:hypothetical protein
VANALAAADIGGREILAKGVIINGLPILTDEPHLASHFREIGAGGYSASIQICLRGSFRTGSCPGTELGSGQ